VDVDRVLQPLTGARPADVVTAGATVGRVLDVDAFARSELSAVIAGVVVVVRDTLAAEVELLDLDLAGDRRRRAAVRAGRRCRRGRRRGSRGRRRHTDLREVHPIDVADTAGRAVGVHDELDHVLARGERGRTGGGGDRLP